MQFCFILISIKRLIRLATGVNVRSSGRAGEDASIQIRGVDVFKALAMGADGVLLGRPFVTAVYGGAAEGVQCYIDKIGGELEDTMRMCGANTISDISRDMIFRA